MFRKRDEKEENSKDYTKLCYQTPWKLSSTGVTMKRLVWGQFWFIIRNELGKLHRMVSVTPSESKWDKRVSNPKDDKTWIRALVETRVFEKHNKNLWPLDMGFRNMTTNLDKLVTVPPLNVSYSNGTFSFWVMKISEPIIFIQPKPILLY